MAEVLLSHICPQFAQNTQERVWILQFSPRERAGGSPAKFRRGRRSWPARRGRRAAWGHLGLICGLGQGRGLSASSHDGVRRRWPPELVLRRSYGAGRATNGMGRLSGAGNKWRRFGRGSSNGGWRPAKPTASASGERVWEDATSNRLELAASLRGEARLDKKGGSRPRTPG
jgi:hypothetical protein